MKRECCVVFVGDEQCGKTSLCKAYLEGNRPLEYSPTVDETYHVSVQYRKKQRQLTIRDTSGREVYDRFRPLAYNDCDVFVICFDISNPTSLDNIKAKWQLETECCCVGASTVLVGCKTDLRGIGATKTVEKEEGSELADIIGAATYVECSIFDRQSVCHVFKMIGRTALKREQRQGSWWKRIWRKVTFR